MKLRSNSLGMINMGMLVSLIAAAAAMGFGVYAFIANSNPYRTIPQALQSEGHGELHVNAEIERPSVVRDLVTHTLSFTVHDAESGEQMPVVYVGAIPESFDQAPKVVVIGEYKQGVFHASQIQTKCPSRYDSKSASVK